MKLVIIGGGSTYTPELLDGIARRKEFLPFKEIVLVDTNAERLSILTEFSKRQLKHLKSNAIVSSTSDLERALDGADFVVSQIRVGGQAARQRDTELGLKYDLVGQETTGCGGFACALRHIPVSLHIAHAMEKHCPNATLLNFTNPAGIVTQALLKGSKIKTVGICNVPWVMRKDIADFYHVPYEKVELNYFGLNHLSWTQNIRVEGVDKTEDVLKHALKLNEDRYRFSSELLHALSALPSPYLRYYYFTPDVVKEIKHSQKTRAQEVMEIESFLLKRYADPHLCDKPPELMKRGGIYYGEVAASAMQGLVSGASETHVLNLPNGNVFPWLPKDAVIEFPWKVSKGQMAPQKSPEVPETMKSLMIQVKTYETLTVEAALSGSREKAYLALLANPLVGTASKVEPVLDELLKINQPYLPQFKPPKMSKSAE